MHPGHAPGLLDQPGHLGLPHQPEAGQTLGLLGQEIEKIPLRHQRDEPASRRQMAEIAHCHGGVTDLRADSVQFLVRPAQECIQHAKLVQHLQRRGMDGVAAEIAQEIRVLLQHQHLHPGARQQQAQHHPGRARRRPRSIARISRPWLPAPRFPPVASASYPADPARVCAIARCESESDDDGRGFPEGGPGLSPPSPAGKAGDRAHQAHGHAARSGAGLFPRRRRRLRGDRGQSGGRLRLHRPRQSGRRHLQRHRGAGPGQYWRAGQQAGDGGQGRPVQEIRRHRRVRYRGGRTGPGQILRRGRRAGADLRRDQP